MSAPSTAGVVGNTNGAPPEYAGFWRRFGAFLIDSIVVSIILIPALWLLEKLGVLAPALASTGNDMAWLVQLLSAPQGDDAHLSLTDILGLLGNSGGSSTGSTLAQALITLVFSVAFWLARQATPGKIIVSARVVDAKTLGPITPGQAIGRYLGYFVSSIPFGLGLLWVAFDPRKQGWHDKLAGTLVIVDRPKNAKG